MDQKTETIGIALSSRIKAHGSAQNVVCEGTDDHN
jgi:hypothetical protein